MNVYQPILVAAVAGLVATSVAFATPGDELPARAVRLIEKGDELVASGELAQAVERYERAHRITDRESIEIALRLVRAHHALGQYRKAVELAEESQRLATSPTEKAELAVLAGKSYYRSAYLALVVQGPPYAFEGSPHANESWVQGMKMAQDFFALAGRTSPETVPEAFYFLGRVSEVTKKPKRAIELYGAYLERAPGGPRAASARMSLEYLQRDRPPVFLDEGMVGPMKIEAPQPRYTPDARKARITGTVIVLALIDERGETSVIELVKDLPLGLGTATVEAIEQWRFVPARSADGETTAVYYLLTVTFQLSR